MSISWVYYTSIKMFFKFLGTEGASEARPAPAALSGLRSPLLGWAEAPVCACVILGSCRIPFFGLHWMLGNGFCKDRCRNSPLGTHLLEGLSHDDYHPPPRGSQWRNHPQNQSQGRLCFPRD